MRVFFQDGPRAGRWGYFNLDNILRVIEETSEDTFRVGIYYIVKENQQYMGLWQGWEE